MSFLFVDRILQLGPKEVRGIKQVTADDRYLSRDEAGRLCFTPSLIGETLGQLTAWSVMASNNFSKRPVAGLVGKAELLRSVYPGQTLFLESCIEEMDDTAIRYNSVATVDGLPVFRIENALGPMLPMSNFIDEATVRRQFAAINRPGDWLQLKQTVESSLTKVEPSNARAVDNLTSRPTSCSLSAGSMVLATSLQPAGKPWEVGSSGNAEPTLVHLNFDSILDYQAGEQISAEKLVNFAAPYFTDHFPNQPVLPMTVLLEAKLNLAAEFLRREQLDNQYRIAEMRKIKMNDFVQPGDILHSQLTIKKNDPQEMILSCRSFVADKRVCVLDLVMKPRGAE